MRFKKSIMFFLLIGLTLVIAACGASAEESESEESSSDNEQAKETEEQTNESSELDGSVVIDGSGTVYPLMARLAEEYMSTEQENVSVEVSRTGTSAGFEKLEMAQ